jgi:hypothetical protein
MLQAARVQRSLAAFLVSLSACAGTARTDPSFLVRPELRSAAPIGLPAEAKVSTTGTACGTKEQDRAKSTLGALVRELDRSDFVLIDPKDPPEEGPKTPALALDLAIVLDDCERGLFGDVMLTLTSTGGASIDRIAMENVWFSNIAGLATDLADRVARSNAVADFAARRGGK